MISYGCGDNVGVPWCTAEDALGIQARKVAINGTLTSHFIGIAPCSMYEADAHYPDGVPGPNGVTKAGMVFKFALAGGMAHGMPVYNLVANETGRCAGLREYAGRTVPMLLRCEKADVTQRWVFPKNVTRIGSILSVSAMDAAVAVEAAGGSSANTATALAVSNSTLFG
jgi:hypothetical protein